MVGISSSLAISVSLGDGDGLSRIRSWLLEYGTGVLLIVGLAGAGFALRPGPEWVCSGRAASNFAAQIDLLAKGRMPDAYWPRIDRS